MKYPIESSDSPPAMKVTPEIDEPAIAPGPLKRAVSSSRDLAPPQSFAPLSKAVRTEPTPVKVFEDPGASPDPVVADLDADIPTPVFSAYQAPSKKRGMGSLYVLLFLMLVGGGLYAAWMYEPGFRELAQPWVDRVLSALKVPGQAAKPAAQSQPAPTAPAPSQSAGTGAAATVAAPQTAQGATSAATETSTAGQTPSPAPTDAGKDAAQSSESDSNEPGPAETAKATSATDLARESAKEEPKKRVLAAVPTDAELPGEKTAIILSSQGADKRLIHHVQPPYPGAARRERIEGTVVLKAIVSETGKVAGVRLVEGNPTLATAAISTVKQWRYRPYVRNGKALPFQTIVLVDFQRH